MSKRTGALWALPLVFLTACAPKDTREEVELKNFQFKGIAPTANYIEPRENAAQIRVTGERLSGHRPFAVTVGVPCSAIITERTQPFGPNFDTTGAIYATLSLEHRMAVTFPSITTKESVLTELSLDGARAQAKEACNAAPPVQEPAVREPGTN